MRAFGLVVLGLAGCVSSSQDYAKLDLSKVPDDKIVLVGTIRSFDHGVDRTGSTAIEVTGSSGGFSLPDSGDVLWIVDRPKAGTPLRLTWTSTLDGAMSFADGFVLARADIREKCAYFGTVTMRFHERREDELSNAVVGFSFPGGGATQADEGNVHLSSLVGKYPNLKGLTCDAVLRRTSVRAE